MQDVDVKTILVPVKTKMSEDILLTSES